LLAVTFSVGVVVAAGGPAYLHVDWQPIATGSHLSGCRDVHLDIHAISKPGGHGCC